MTGEEDGDDAGRDYSLDGEGDGTDGAGAGVGEADPDADAAPDVDPDAGVSTDSDGERREPLGSLRDRVVEDPDDEPAVAFPEASASGDAGDDTDGGDRGDGDADGDRRGPLGDLAAGVDERRRHRDAGEDELFESMDVGEVDADALWDQVEAEEPSVATPGSREVREVDKRKYCAGCPYFSRPPAVGCEHDGTDILEQVDMETFKVADCPIVLEDERLEDATTD